MELNNTNQLAVPINADKEDPNVNSVFLEHMCKCCNGKLTVNDASKEDSKDTVELLYGLHDSPAIHIAFLCGLQVRSAILAHLTATLP